MTTTNFLLGVIAIFQLFNFFILVDIGDKIVMNSTTDLLRTIRYDVSMMHTYLKHCITKEK